MKPKPFLRLVRYASAANGCWPANPVRAMELKAFSVFCICVGLMSHVQSEKSPLPWNRDALLDGGCRYRQPDVVHCLNSIRGARDKLRFAFMGDSRDRQRFFSFVEVSHQFWKIWWIVNRGNVAVTDVPWLWPAVVACSADQMEKVSSWPGSWQWKDEVPVKGVAYHQYFAVKSELLGIVFRYHFFGIMNQDFIIALAN